ncbi:hypothetical protein FB380_003710 [Modestobacter marinus]|uniref:Uncharacterized protein n=2 Tax=Modestobacter marinus TaxID=477641 RepID=A0A846LSG8_9ACTN|nr:hypothetical protein [Modestobacter marinus]
MWVRVRPKWMRPGSRFSRATWLASLPVAAVLIWFGWMQVGTGSTGEGKVFLVVWTVGIVAIEAWNFRTLYLGRGRRAEALQRSTDEQGPQ